MDQKDACEQCGMEKRQLLILHTLIDMLCSISIPFQFQIYWDKTTTNWAKQFQIGLHNFKLRLTGEYNNIKLEY